MPRDISALSRWKRDLQIAAAWMNAPLIYLTFAQILYSSFPPLQVVPQWKYLLLSGLFFVPFYKLLGLLIIRLGLYAAEMRYNYAIDPYQVNRLTDKEKVVYMISLVNTHAIIHMSKSLGFELTEGYLEAVREFESLIATNCPEAQWVTPDTKLKPKLMVPQEMVKEVEK